MSTNDQPEKINDFLTSATRILGLLLQIATALGPILAIFLANPGRNEADKEKSR